MLNYYFYKINIHKQMEKDKQSQQVLFVIIDFNYSYLSFDQYIEKINNYLLLLKSQPFMKHIKKSPIKSFILGIQPLQPLKIYDKSTNTEQKFQNISQNFNTKMSKSTVFENVNQVTRLRNQKNKALKDRENKIGNFELEQTTEYYQLLTNISNHTRNLTNIIKIQRSNHNQYHNNSHRKYSIFSKRKQSIISNFNTLKNKYSVSRSFQDTERQNLSKQKTKGQPKVSDKIQENNFIQKHKLQNQDRQQIQQSENKRIKSVENEESLNKSNLQFENLHTDYTYRDVYRINKINMFDYEKIKKRNSDYQRGIGKFFNFCNQRRTSLESKLQKPSKKMIKQYNSPEEKSNKNSDKAFQPYHQQNFTQISNTFTPQNRKKRMSVVKKAQDQQYRTINIIGLYTQQLRKKQNTQIHRIQNYLSNEDFTLEGWKEYSILEI